jgi:hypothetical protein
MPATGDDGHQQASDIEYSERDDLAPRERVTDATVQRVRPIFRKADDVGLRLDAGQLPTQACDSGADEHGAQPQGHPGIEPPLE